MLNIKRLILALTAIISITTAWAQQGAQILSDELTYNFGTIAEADGFASHTFTIKNTGDAPLVITRVTRHAVVHGRNGLSRRSLPVRPVKLR